MKVALHTCCGPCASACVPRLKDDGHRVVMYFANSNIDTEEEFERRKAAAKQLAETEGVEFQSAEYDHADWLEKVAKGFEDEPEKGKRCERCYAYNLKKTEQFATTNGCEAFCTSLTVSPHKPSEKIFAANESVAFMKADFKKKEGFKLSVKRAAELGLYRQSYCGCEFGKQK